MDRFPGIARIQSDWESVLGYLTDQNAIIVLDEFPYLIEEDQSLPSVLQAMFDHELEDSSSTIVLVGSSISMMEKATLLGNSPLYGRSSVKLDIRQLPISAAMEFFPDDFTPDEQLLTWGVFGGTPYYLEQVSNDGSIGEIIQHTVLSRYGPLHNEPDYVIRMELAEPTRYFSILESIASGETTRNTIAQRSGIDYNQLSKYLNRLERLRLVERTVPITERKEKSKRGHYHIRDQLFRFWFRFIYGYGDRYDQLEEDAYSTLIEPELSDFVSGEFERLCQSALRSLYPHYTIIETGKWWYKEHEIDVVGITNGDTLIAGECKFQNAPLGYKPLSKLEEHVEQLQWKPTGGGERTCEYALFSRSGFKQSVKEAAGERSDLRLFSVDDVINVF